MLEKSRAWRQYPWTRARAELLPNATDLSDNWRSVRQKVRSFTGSVPGEGVLVIGDSDLERERSDAGSLAGYLTVHRYFA